MTPLFVVYTTSQFSQVLRCLLHTQRPLHHVKLLLQCILNKDIDQRHRCSLDLMDTYLLVHCTLKQYDTKISKTFHSEEIISRYGVDDFFKHWHVVLATFPNG